MHKKVMKMAIVMYMITYYQNILMNDLFTRTTIFLWNYIFLNKYTYKTWALNPVKKENLSNSKSVLQQTTGLLVFE